MTEAATSTGPVVMVPTTRTQPPGMSLPRQRFCTVLAVTAPNAPSLGGSNLDVIHRHVQAYVDAHTTGFNELKAKVAERRAAAR